MKKIYKVAEHIFTLELPDSSAGAIERLLKNYEPFDISVSVSGECAESLFTLSLEDSSNPYNVDHADEAISSGLLKEIYAGHAEPDEPKLDIYDTESGEWQVEMAPWEKIPSCASLIIRKDCSYARLYLKQKKYCKFALDNSLMVMYAFRTAGMNTLEMHSSVVVNGGRAVMFLGHSGAGKSTHSRMWLENIDGTELMNDDNPIVRLSENGEVIAYGSPWSGKTSCYRNMCAPVSAFVNILQHPSNNIEKCSILETYASIYSSTSGFKLMEDQADGLHSTISGVMSSVPCYNLRCLPDRDAARLCKQTVFNEQ